MYLRGRGQRFVTVCDRGGVKFVKSSVCKRYEKPVISKDYYYTNTIYINVQKNSVVRPTFEFTGAALDFMIMSSAARGVKKVGQHCPRYLDRLSVTSLFLNSSYSILYISIKINAMIIMIIIIIIINIIIIIIIIIIVDRSITQH